MSTLTLLLAVLLLSACPGRQPAASTAEPVLPTPAGPMEAESLLADVQRFCAPDFAGRGSYQRGSALASQFVFEEFEKLGYRVIRQPIRGRHAENIIAIKEGDGQAIMVSAHHDHLGRKGADVYLGADDNASGLALLMAIARSRAASDYRHTVLFVSFGAEEDGLVGSGIYVRDPVWPLKDTKAVINFDMVGRDFFDAGASQKAAAAVVGLEDSAPAQIAAERAAEGVGLNLIQVPARLLELFNLHDRTDDWWFRRQGIPCIHFSTGLHDDYHQVTDTVEKIVPEQLARIAHTAAAILDALADPAVAAEPAGLTSKWLK